MITFFFLLIIYMLTVGGWLVIKGICYVYLIVLDAQSIDHCISDMLVCANGGENPVLKTGLANDGKLREGPYLT